MARQNNATNGGNEPKPLQADERGRPEVRNRQLAMKMTGVLPR